MERIERLADAEVERTEVVYECCPDEVEERQLKLVETLAGASAVPARPAAVRGKKARRAPRTGAPVPPHSPEPAA
jgi:hypothetical protein